jgi:quinol monooxygenase YgiN
MNDGVTITFELRLKPEAVDGFVQIAPQILQSPSEFDGFRGLRIVQHKDDPTRILFVEKWDSEEAYKAYLAVRMPEGNMGQLGQIVTSTETNIWSNVLGEIAR